jgi:hypothetical protein
VTTLGLIPVETTATAGALTNTSVVDGGVF